MIVKRGDIEKFLKQPGQGVRAALIHGDDLGVVRERARTLAGAATERPDDPFDVALLAPADLEADPARLEGELCAISMMGGRRLVRLRLTDEREASRAAEALTDHLAGAFNPDAFFLIEAPRLRKDHALRKIAEKNPGCGAVECFSDDTGDIVRFAREALAADKLSLTAEAMELFVSRLPHERGVARQEIERLALFLGPGGTAGASAGADDLTEFLGVEPEASLADAAIDAFGGRLAAAQAGLRRAAREGQGGPAAVRAMGMHLDRLRRIITLHRAGATLQEAAKRARVFWKNEREVMRQARVWGLAEVDAVQGEILGADQACKQTGSPDGLLAERLALTIAGRARRLGL